MSRWKRFAEISNKRANVPLPQNHPLFAALFSMIGFMGAALIARNDFETLGATIAIGAVAALVSQGINFYKKAWKDSAEEKSDPQ